MSDLTASRDQVCEDCETKSVRRLCPSCAEKRGMTCPCMSEDCAENAASIEAKRRRDAMTPTEISEEKAAGKAWYEANKTCVDRHGKSHECPLCVKP